MDIHVELAAETLFKIGPIPITNSMLMMFIVMAALILAGNLIARRAKVVPGRTQGAFELIVEFLLNLVEGTAGKRLGRRLFPLIGGLFIFILFSNWTGLLPGVGTIGYYKEEEHESESAALPASGVIAVPFSVGTTGGAPAGGAIAQESDSEGTPEEAVEPGEGSATTGQEPHEAATDEGEHEKKVLVPWFRAPNADLNMTLAMALLAFGIVQIAGVRAHGVVGRLKHMANPPLLFPIELISELSRIVSLSARLFGNVFAGEVLLAVMYALAAAIKVAIIPLLFPVVFLFLELLFGTIQALVFALLTLIYITLAAADDHAESHGDTEHEPATPPVQPVAAAAGGGD